MRGGGRDRGSLDQGRPRPPLTGGAGPPLVEKTRQKARAGLRLGRGGPLRLALSQALGHGAPEVALGPHLVSFAGELGALLHELGGAGFRTLKADAQHSKLSDQVGARRLHGSTVLLCRGYSLHHVRHRALLGSPRTQRFRINSPPAAVVPKTPKAP
jgi:hypothetical protein